MDDLKDMNIIVTGGASGIGRATALLLAQQGARVFVGDIDVNGGQRTAEEAAGKGLAISFAALDLTDAARLAGTGNVNNPRPFDFGKSIYE